jgi:hypothetical protein
MFDRVKLEAVFSRAIEANIGGLHSILWYLQPKDMAAILDWENTLQIQ